MIIMGILTGSGIISADLLYTYAMCVIVRSGTIAAKYSTYNAQKIKMFKEKILSKKQLALELVVVGWFGQSVDQVEEAISEAMYLNGIEGSTFYIAFMKKPNAETEEKIKICIAPEKIEDSVDQQEISSANSEKIEILNEKPVLTPTNFQSSQNHKIMPKKKVISLNVKFDVDNYKKILKIKNSKICYYKGNAIFKYIVQQVNKKGKTKLVIILISIIIGITRTILPVFVINTKGFSQMPKIKVWEYFSISLILLNTMFVITINLFLHLISYRDLIRKNAIMVEMNQMLLPRKAKSQPKLLPTINLIDQNSLLAWRKIRYIARDYGKKFSERHNLYLPIYIFILLVDLIIIIGLRVKLISFAEEKVIFFQGICLVDFISGSLQLLSMLYLAARVNSHYDQDKIALMQARSTIRELNAYKEHFFDYEEEKEEVLVQQHLQIFEEDVQDALTAKFAQKLIEMIGYKKDPSSYLENLLGIYDEILEELDIEKEFGMLKIFGFGVDMRVFWNMLFTVLSAAVGVYNFFFGDQLTSVANQAAQL